MCELRAADLQFDRAEARAFLHTALGRDLEATLLESILTRTEGWAAGLQLTVLSLQGRRSEEQVRTSLADSLGSQRHLVDYLVAEVLAQQPEAVQSFLLHTCILEPLCASLCAAVTGADSPAESAAMLACLERANLFLFPLDERGEWYRYHPLWASVLRVRLLQQDAAASVAALYGRASRWYEQHDLPAEAIEAALSANEDERALQLIEQLSWQLLVRRKHALLRRWIERLSPELWAARPMACLAYAWALFVSGAQDAATTPLQQAERLFRQQANAVGLGMVQAVYAVAAALRGEGRAAIAVGTAALALLPADDRFWRDLCRSVVGSGYWLVGELATAWQTLVQTRAQHERAGDVSGLLADSIVLGNILALQGQLQEAEAYYQRVRDEAGVRRGHAIEAMIRLGQLWYEWNALEEAEAELAQALAEADQVAEDPLLARGVLSLAYAVQARIRQARREHEQASALFRQAVTLAELRRHGRLLAQIQALRLRWWLAQGHLEAVARWREGEAFARDAAPSYEEEPGALALARVLVASGEAGEALRLLERFRAHAHDQGRLGSELELLVLSALAEARRGKMEPAVQHLGQALSLAEPAGYIRLFLDEGPPLLPLLRVVLARGRGQPPAHYVQQLLTLLEDEHPELTGTAHPDQEAGHLSPAVRRISARELAVLRVLAEGLTTRQMAARLVVSPNTIKTQLQSLYRKLDVRTREEALVQAASFHLLETIAAPPPC